MKVASPELVPRPVPMCRGDRYRPQSRSQGQRAPGLDAHRSTTSTTDAKRELKDDLQSDSCSGRGRGLTHSANVSDCSAWMMRTWLTVNILYEELICAREKRSSDPPRTHRLYHGAPRSCSEPQCARVTSSGGAQSVCILSTGPYHGYGVAGPVTGAPTGLWGDIADPIVVGYG